MTELENKIGYHFQNRELLKEALTHSSYANEHKAQHIKYNERLEFLGDAVLSIVVSDYIFKHCPELPEGELTKLRAALVCEVSLFEFAKKIQLGNYLILSKMLIILGAFGAEDYAQMLVHQHVVDHPSNPVL